MFWSNMDPYKFIGKYADDILKLFYKCMKKIKTPEKKCVQDGINIPCTFGILSKDCLSGKKKKN